MLWLGSLMSSLVWGIYLAWLNNNMNNWQWITQVLKVHQFPLSSKYCNTLKKYKMTYYRISECQASALIQKKPNPVKFERFTAHDSKKWLIFTFQRECLAGRWERGKTTRRTRATDHRGSRSFAHTSGVTFRVVWVYSRADEPSWTWLRCLCNTTHSFSPHWSFFQSLCVAVCYLECWCCGLTRYEMFFGIWKWFIDNPWLVVCFDIPTG